MRTVQETFALIPDEEILGLAHVQIFPDMEFNKLAEFLEQEDADQ